MLIVQKMGKIENSTIKTLVAVEISDSSQLSFLNVVNLHAMDAKLNIAIIGVIKGKTNINKINKAFNPKKNLSAEIEITVKITNKVFILTSSGRVKTASAK